MREYLDKQKLLMALNDKYHDMSVTERLHVSEEVASVRHSKWKLFHEDYRRQIEGYECTACGFRNYGTVVKHYRHCPACGAEMDLEEDK